MGIFKKTTLGIYGGTFAPIHNGHVAAAKSFYDAVKLDKLLIMPTYISPHKKNLENDDPEARLEMVRLAFEGDIRNIVPCGYEIEKGGKSYTYLTLKHFASPFRRIIFLCGTDMFLSLPEWKHPEIIFRLAEIALIRREITDSETEERISFAKDRYKKEFSAKIIDIDASPVDISSTDIREMISCGKDIGRLVPPRVCDYIAANRLYGNKSAAGGHNE